MVRSTTKDPAKIRATLRKLVRLAEEKWGEDSDQTRNARHDAKLLSKRMKTMWS
jgi:hypothetical protein